MGTLPRRAANDEPTIAKLEAHRYRMALAGPARGPGRFVLAGGVGPRYLPQRRPEIVDKFHELRLPRRSRFGEDVLQMGLHGIFRDGERMSSLGNRAAFNKVLQGSRFSASQSEALGDSR